MIDPDADALLRAIVRHPDDDTPRLVYADWLQENGRAEEGEFLRAQCRLAATDPDDPEYPELLEREEELRLWLGTHVPGPRLTFPAGLSVEGGNRWWEYTHRGFPRFLEFDGYQKQGAKAMRALAASLERAFDALPTRWLVVRDVTVAQLAALLKQSALAKLAQLTVILPVNGDEANDAARLLAGCRHLRNLRGLAPAFGFGDAGCDALAAAPWGRLEWLWPDCDEISPAGLRALAGSSWFRQLHEITLMEALPAETFEALAQLPPFPHLHTLDLSRNAFFTPAGWDAFARTRTFPALVRVRLDEADLGGERLTALATATGFSLSVLSARQCGTGPGTGAALAAAPWAGSLHVLGLGYNGLDPADVKALAECKKFDALRHLDLSGNALGPVGLSALGTNPALRGLRALNLAGRPGDNRGLGPAHFERFLARLDAPDLRHLDLSGRPVGPKAVRRLTDPKFAALARLGLKGCKLTDPAVAALVAAQALRRLIQLDLSDNRLTTGPEPLADRSVLPCLASCAITANALPAAVVRKLRRRPGVRLERST
jgi:uncharacterized protein (TIGR02996 family)